ncbi:hypothetical protein HYFRA_00005584 [Hymenoscyphus fraxineus]|uniref:2EXR domain-containing protein n=1 Tax=Hymenoscyphus fraxineus TaxID=746836 RepID=A0A9N9KTE0_9HELO|nr:hypothetical protein HYFRA_00005584 [Hymenoscyphus fraxineus]
MASQIVDASVAGDCATEFTCFPRLPTELRFKIWGVICNTSRDLWIGTTYYSDTSDYSKLSEDEKEGMRSVFRYYTFSLPPAVLHVSHESRFEGLKYYTLAFGSGYRAAGHKFETNPRTYVNFQVDRICPHVGCMSTLDFMPWKLMVKQPIRCLAFPWHHPDDPNNYYYFFNKMAERIETVAPPFFLKYIEEFTLFDPEILKGPRKDLPKERSEEAMTFTYWDLCDDVLVAWACESICYPIDDESCWQVINGTLGGLRKTVVVNGERDKPWRRCHNSLPSPPAEQNLKVPAVKIVELNEGNAEKYIGVTNLPIYEKLRARYSEKSNL